MAIKVQVTFDAADPPALAAFWGETLGYVEQDPPEGFDSWEAWAVANDLPQESWDDYASRVDPDGAAWRLTALLDGLGVQVAVHRGLPEARLVDWVRAAAAAELAVDPATLAGDPDRDRAAERT